MNTYKLLVFLFVMTFINTDVSAQCEGEVFFNKCKLGISNYTFLKSYFVDVKKSKKGEDRINRFTYIFSKGSEYVITACNEENKPCNVIVNLLDFNKRLISSTYFPKSNKYYPSINYKCNATGMYYVTFTTSQAEGECCGMSILAFKKN